MDVTGSAAASDLLGVGSLLLPSAPIPPRDRPGWVESDGPHSAQATSAAFSSFQPQTWDL